MLSLHAGNTALWGTMNQRCHPQSSEGHVTLGELEKKLQKLPYAKTRQHRGAPYLNSTAWTLYSDLGKLHVQAFIVWISL